jgi:hypothetical protein
MGRALWQAILVMDHQPSLNQLDCVTFIVQSNFRVTQLNSLFCEVILFLIKKGSLRDLNAILVGLAGTSIPDLRSFTTQVLCLFSSNTKKTQESLSYCSTAVTALRVYYRVGPIPLC